MVTGKRHCLLMDSGLRTPAENLGLDQAALDHLTHGDQGTLRFYRQTRGAALGRHQWSFEEVRADYCDNEGIQLVRRITGGGALYLDPDQLAFSLTLPHDGTSLEDALKKATAALALGFDRLGISTEFQFPNDLITAGRKIASVFAIVEGRNLLLHGTVLLDTDVERALKALRVPTEKLNQKGYEGFASRLTTLGQQLGETPAWRDMTQAFSEGFAAVYQLEMKEQSLELSPAEPSRFLCTDAHTRPYDKADPREGLALWKTKGGLLRARIRFSEDFSRVDICDLGGDVVLSPTGLFEAVMDKVTGCKLNEVESAVLAALAPIDAPQMLGFDKGDMAKVIGLCINRLKEREELGLSPKEANNVMVMAPDHMTATDVLEKASVMLVPYCAKMTDCKFRFTQGCSDCNKCTVGDAYRLGRERNMEIVTINNFEHLCGTLDDMKNNGVEAYVGMCCEQFYIKRNHAFSRAAMPTVLMDITGANCYELGEEEQAYSGVWQAQADLDLGLLDKVMDKVPSCSGGCSGCGVAAPTEENKAAEG